MLHADLRLAPPRAITAIAGLFAVLLLSTPASASTITLSDVSSDATPASTLDATLEFMVLGGDTLQLTVTNDTSGLDEFNINEVYWNANAGVSGLTLTSATHSVNGDVLAAWTPVETVQMADGFGTFDFALTDGVGEMNPNIIMPGNDIVFLMDISGTCADALSCTMTDFVVGNAMDYTAAAKFVNGPDDPESPGNEDSAFGAAVVPEPSTALLLGLGLAGLARRRSRR